MATKKNRPLIGMIGMGFIGSNYAFDFKKRGYEVVSYAKEKPYDQNAGLIKNCDMVFIAVPTPSTPHGFDDSIVRSALKLVGKGKIAVIKSTITPGTTAALQKANPEIFVFNSPEFLTEATARHDAQYPNRSIVGMPKSTAVYKRKAKEVMDVLAPAPYKLICTSLEAELVKYGGNCWFYHKVVFMNELYDLSHKLGADYYTIRDGMAADPRIGHTHLDPIHKSGRGAGGNCFIKDFAAFSNFYEALMPHDKLAHKHLRATEEKNLALLASTKKDLHLLRGVYGEKAVANLLARHGKKK